MRRFASLVIAALVGVLLVPVGAVPPALAAPGAPVLTAPSNGAVVDANPVLRWSAVSGATKYEVQVANTPTFSGTLAFTSSTTGTVATPPTDLPLDTYSWRVRAVDSAGVAGPFAVASFEKVTREAPTPVYPVDRSAGQELVYPQDSLYYKWDAFPGAKSYEVQIGTDVLFTGAPAPIAVSTTTYAPLTPPAFGTEFWWRVRAKSANNVYSDWSVGTPYTMKWSPTPVELVSPPSTNTPSVEEVVLNWNPVAGAAYYELQVSPDANFNNPVVKGADNTKGRKVVGTRFSDNDTTTAEALNLPAGAYYWRVRAMSTSVTAEPGPWSETSTFTRAWPATSTQEAALPNGTLTAESPSPQVTLIAPADKDYSLAEPRLSWTPQRGASHYEVEFSSDSAFSPARVASCFTNHTTLTPFWRVRPNMTSTCQPRNSLGETIVRPGVVAYWRVRALDGPESPALNGVFTSGRSFLYEKPGLAVTAPADGATVSVPVLRWSATDSTSLHKVTLQAVNPPPNTYCAPVTAWTYNTTYVPETLSPKCSSWQWTVQGVEDNNNTSYNDGYESRIPLGGWRSFTWNRAVGSAAEPAPVTMTPIAAHLPPLLQWPAVTGAEEYQVYFSRSGADSFTAVTATGTNATGYAFTGSLGTPLGRLLSTGDYDFFVRALAPGGSTISDSPLGTFHVQTLPGAKMTGPAHCPLNSCTAVEYDTPTFTWDPVQGAGLYILYLATDPNFTNITHEFRTVHTQFTPAESLPDSQAGQATYWYVRSCYMPAECGDFDISVFGDARAFRKQTVPVETESPVNGHKETTGQVRFAWKDYLYANQAKGVTQEAAWYQVQVSTTANFTNVVETSPKIDATEYTADLKTYPDGPLYWRVQAFDNSANPLTFSTPVSFSKAVQGPSGLAPDTTAAGSAGQTPVLTWAAQAFTTQYEVEIYRSSGDPSAALSPTNRVGASIKTRLPSAVSPTALAAGQYAWRVRTIDINNNAGQWSSDRSPTPNLDGALAHFVVGATGPVLNEPANGSTHSSGTVEFSWQQVDSATRYRIEVSSTINFATPIESATTDMTRWSPDLLTPVWPNGTIFWRVHALDGNGAILTTSETRSFTRDASTAGEFTAVSPYRVLDTRKTGNPLGSGQTRTLTVVGGNTGIPSSGVSAVVLNATVTGPTRTSYLTLWPAGITRPTVSTLNYVAGQTVANHATIPVDAAGRISMYNSSGSTQVLIDVVGYYSNGKLQRANRYTAGATPTRIADTRVGSTALAQGEARRMEVAGRGGVPADATAVIMNVTAVTPTKDGYFTVYPAGKTRPNASSLNFRAKVNVPNLVTMPLGSDGDVVVYNAAGSTHLLMDVVGWHVAGDPAPGTRMNSVAPTRIVDTRGAQKPRLTAGQPRAFQVRGVGGVPNDPKVTAAVVNVTVVNPAGNGYATVYPSGTPLPTSSNLNYLRGQTVANQVLVRVGSDGKIAINSVQATDVIVDVVGWFG